MEMYSLQWKSHPKTLNFILKQKVHLWENIFFFFCWGSREGGDKIEYLERQILALQILVKKVI